MLHYKKTIITMLTLACNIAFAGAMGEKCTPDSVNLACDNRYWEIGAHALYLQSSSGVFNHTTGPLVDNGNIIFPNYADNWIWGFEVEGNYDFSKGKGVNVNWYHLNKSTNLRIDGTLVYPLGYTFTNVSGPHDTTWDAVNFELGQQINLGTDLNLRLHGGAEYVSLSNRVNWTAEGTTATQYVVTDRQQAYIAGGPRFGADLFYDFNDKFSIYGKSAIGVYAGTSKMTRYLVLGNGASSYTTASSMLVTPEIEGKLGAQYQYPMQKSTIDFDAGWMMITYRGALFFTNNIGALDNHDMSFQGPYFGVRWVG